MIKFTSFKYGMSPNTKTTHTHRLLRCEAQQASLMCVLGPLSLFFTQAHTGLLKAQMLRTDGRHLKTASVYKAKIIGFFSLCSGQYLFQKCRRVLFHLEVNAYLSFQLRGRYRRTRWHTRCTITQQSQFSSLLCAQFSSQSVKFR